MVLKNKKQESLKIHLRKLNKLRREAFLNKKKIGNNDLKSLNNGYLESIEYFRQRYLIEKRRAERKSYEFSLIIIEMNCDEKRVQQRKYISLFEEIQQSLFTILKMILRATDVVVKYCPFKLAILLPDTDQAGTELVIHRIKAALEEIADNSNAFIINNTRISFYSYPLQEDEINIFINDNIINKNTSTLRLEKMIREINSCYFQLKRANEINAESNNLNIKISSYNTLTLENPFCILNEAFYNFCIDWQKVVKRYLDILLSLIALIILFPVILIISVLIKITSSGPILFKQKRIGYLGKNFTMFKFRTMYQVKDEKIHKGFINDFIKNNDQLNQSSDNNNHVFKMTNDPRITQLGKFLRKTSLDEILQFINVLKGDMSLVGPRPPIPYEVEMYDLWHKRRFLTVKPGITGLWQIYGRSRTTFNDMVRLDLAYANNWSLALDLKIILSTIWVVLSMKGAY